MTTMPKDFQDNQLTVGELIDKLQQFDRSLPVITDGCDCVGEYCDVSYREENEHSVARIIILRDAR